jgi:hypothetical protein
MVNEWILIDKFGDSPKEYPIFLADEYGDAYVGFNVFDYYDGVYWFPMPKFPMCAPVITHDSAIRGLIEH